MTGGPWDGDERDRGAGDASRPPRTPADPIRRTETEKRRRPKGRLVTFWRVVAVLALALFGWALWLASQSAEPGGPHVARFEVTGLITVDDARDSLLREIADDPDARALILSIDSPGGTATGSEALYEAVRRVAARKPVVAVLGEVAASGGYVAALGADRIVTRGNTLTGSIGIVSQRPDLRGLLDSLGIDIVESRSGAYKARPSPFEETPPAVEAWEAELIADSFAWFRDLVAERRALSGDALEGVTDGRVFTGRQALERGLVDEIGGPVEARAWLAAEGVAPSVPVRTRRVPEETSLLREVLGVSASAALDSLRRFALQPGPRLFALAE